LVKELARQEAQQVFDLGRGPLLRACLLRVQAQEHLFLLTMHHVTSDGWSNAILMQELASVYNGWVTRTPVSLPDLPVQYADFASGSASGCKERYSRRSRSTGKHAWREFQHFTCPQTIQGPHYKHFVVQSTA